YRGSAGPVFCWMDEATNTPRKLWERLKGYECLVVPHHPPGLWFTNPLGGLAVMDWSHANDEMERLVEIFSNWGNSERLGDEDNFTLLTSGGHFVQDALDMGRKLGLIASSDSHNGHPGLTGLYDHANYDPELEIERTKDLPKDPRHRRTSPAKMRGCLVAVYAKELTREAVYDALRSCRCYATTGTRPIVEFTVNGAGMGSCIRGARQRRIAARVIAGQTIRRLEVFRGDEVIRSVEPDSKEGELTHTDGAAAAPGTFYYLRVTEESGDKAWSSPIWIG
ncbi:MAG: DUF3604 domain-containing protein, partial [Planctomycetota bacterium]